ncbi:Rut operon repressor [Ruegeria sp. THAF57]|uniref:TetR family transcriptional regulator C-terminal domain-containing protein n=1 Tax=Ruegeria sp. THAF57 TaxID=2744555 RepID=UPI0015DD5BE2|nr:TetR family transcriptional regulator C-terminal domain-containing protein [Ruegeria sp. THAF57]CAD0183289.1 Rut operon repressor [Ruegeria sp. THAF57]
MPEDRAPTRIQKKNRAAILDAALNVFSAHGFRGATVDQIAAEAGLSKPNLLYYFPSKEAIHTALLSGLLDTWLAPLHDLDAQGDPMEEILAYIQRKLEMSRDLPRESRLFANELVQGAPRIHDSLSNDLKALVDEKTAILSDWMDQGRIARLHPYHLIFSIWALTQHYADFDVQVRAILGDEDPYEGAEPFVDTLYRKLLTP